MFDDPDAFRRLLDEFYPYRERFETHRSLPATGLGQEEVLEALRWMAHREDEQGHAGRVSGSLYHGDPEHYAFLTEAFGLFAHANVLQRDMYPSATKFEAEIVAMTARMLGGDPADGVCGVLTGGGTESLTTQLLVYRDHARATRGITDPQVVLPVTAHCALDKAAHYFGVELVKAPVGDDGTVDTDWVADHVTDRTVALFGSAGTYPHGVVDPITDLGAIALEHGIGLHVDGCLGGFILPWAQRLGYDVPPFDFSVPGVTSISADTHKFGYGLKGTSVLLYRDRDLRKQQYFAAAQWPGGLYISPGMAGSRSGGLIASTWAAMVTMGEEGYLREARPILEAAARMRAGVEAIEELVLIGRSPFMVAFRSAREDLDVFVVNDGLVARGWRLNGTQLPSGLHFCVTRPTTADGVVDAFLADLRASVDEAKGKPVGSARSGALYGLSGAGADGVAAVGQMLGAALDAFYEPAP